MEFSETCRDIDFPVAMAAGTHPFPFRTRPLSPPAPMVLGDRSPGRVGRRRGSSIDERPPTEAGVVASAGRARPVSCSTLRRRDQQWMMRSAAGAATKKARNRRARAPDGAARAAFRTAAREALGAPRVRAFRRSAHRYRGSAIRRPADDRRQVRRPGRTDLRRARRRSVGNVGPLGPVRRVGPRSLRAAA